MKLYGSGTSPYVRKVRIYANELGLEDRIEDIATAVTPAEVNEEYAARNPLIQVPALETDSGMILSDSHIICDHLARLVGIHPHPVDDAVRDTALQEHALINGATEAMVQCAYEVTRRPKELRWEAYLTGRFAKVDNALQVIAGSTSDLLDAGDTLSLNQCALIAALGYADLRFSDRVDWRSHDALQRFWTTVEIRGSVSATTPKP